MTQQTYSKQRQRDSDHYSVYWDADDGYLFSGTVNDICKKLDITKSCVCKAVTENHLVRRKYRIYYDGEK